jgi:hypothetical protein
MPCGATSSRQRPGELHDGGLGREVDGGAQHALPCRRRRRRTGHAAAAAWPSPAPRPGSCGTRCRRCWRTGGGRLPGRCRAAAVRRSRRSVCISAERGAVGLLERREGSAQRIPGRWRRRRCCASRRWPCGQVRRRSRPRCPGRRRRSGFGRADHAGVHDCRSQPRISFSFGGLPVISTPTRKILPAALKAIQHAGREQISSDARDHVLVDLGRAAGAVHHRERREQRHVAEHLGDVPLGSCTMNIIETSGTISRMKTGCSRFCASFRLLQTEPRPTRIAA